MRPTHEALLDQLATCSGPDYADAEALVFAHLGGGGGDAEQLPPAPHYFS